MALRTVAVDLDRTRQLRFTVGDVKRIKQDLDVDLLKGDELDTGDVDTIIYLLWLCLRHEDPELKREDVGDLLDVGNLNDLTEKLTDLMSLEDGSDPLAGSGPQSPSTSTSSGPTPASTSG